MEADRPPTHRSGLFILSFQLEGLCTTLRQTVPYNLPVGPATLAMLVRIKKAFDGMVSGPPVENLPDVDKDTSPVDVLMVAEILRSTLLAFLSPEEVDQRRTALGFRSEGNPKA
jgi:hypothetical protein